MVQSGIKAKREFSYILKIDTNASLPVVSLQLISNVEYVSAIDAVKIYSIFIKIKCF